MDFSIVQQASICFSNGRGPSKMLQLRASNGKVLNIYDGEMTGEELQAIRDFVVKICLETTGKTIEVSDHTSKTAFIPDSTNTQS